MIPPETTVPMRPVCPHCGEWRADMLEYDGAARRWFCSQCGRMYRALVPAPMPAADDGTERIRRQHDAT